jgi:hypothetical protein
MWHALRIIFFAEDNHPGSGIIAAAAMPSDVDNDNDESSSSSTQAPHGYDESSVVDETQDGGPILTSLVRVSSTRYPLQPTPERQQTRLQFLSRVLAAARSSVAAATSSPSVAGALASSSTTSARVSGVMTAARVSGATTAARGARGARDSGASAAASSGAASSGAATTRSSVSAKEKKKKLYLQL